MSHTLGTLLQYVLPQHLVSRLTHRVTRSPRMPLRHAVMRWFARRYGVDMSEAEQPELDAYPDFNSFFTRALRTGARPLPEDSHALCCPVDGYVSQLGAINGERVFQAKGHTFSVTELLGGSRQRAQPFINGRFATLYLSPGDYHRIHMPMDGVLTEMVHVPGSLFSVSPACVEAVPRLFARNERVACLFDTRAGPMAVVLVGAINVGSIETVWAGEITPPRGRSLTSVRYDTRKTSPHLTRGAELGRFNLGSTVIVLFGPNRIQWEPGLATQSRVLMGQPLGRWQTAT